MFWCFRGASASSGDTSHGFKGVPSRQAAIDTSRPGLGRADGQPDSKAMMSSVKTATFEVPALPIALSTAHNSQGVRELAPKRSVNMMLASMSHVELSLSLREDKERRLYRLDLSSCPALYSRAAQTASSRPKTMALCSRSHTDALMFSCMRMHS